MDKIAIHLEETNGVARTNEPVSLGIPLPKGAVQANQSFTLMEGQKPLSLQTEPLAHWPDGSIRWIHASFLANVEPNSKTNLLLTRQQAPSPPDAQPSINPQTDNLVVRTSTGSISLQPNSPAWQVSSENAANMRSVVTLSDSTGAHCVAAADNDWELTRQGPVFVTARLKGQWKTQSNEILARFECELCIYLETGLVQVELLTHNPRRARHPGGLWDLGDPGSVHFRELAVETALPGNSTARVKPQATDENPSTFELADFNLYQDSSGGEHWQSRNHVDASGEITTRFCGYRLTAENELQHEGKRANPLVTIEDERGQLELAVPHFWQNFPTSLCKDGSKLTIGLFPKDAKAPYELQGGERKTLRCLMDCQGNTNLAAIAYTPLVPALAPECYEQADALPWFTANTEPGLLDTLIAGGLNGESNFFAKREVIDEFGWRNFGEIFADHETLYQNEGEPPFISHYNNQYDPIYGFARQYALTGDKRWFELMDDLARHVTDIDIYHTDEDRSEYNNGLFWHTDHYLDAHRATHRTFTRHNDTSSTPGQTGGGPAAEHCYTTGLLYHYLLTGSAASKEAALQLARWMVATHEGTGGLLETLLAIKNQDIPKLKALAKGKAVTKHKHPFTRGTGNYLTALIDASILEPAEDWLLRADGVIRATIHPKDSIAERNLLDVETGWSYLILLTAIARFLHEKRMINELDDSYQYAAHSFMAYAEWMRENEKPFLADTEQLEFPNHTWVAQDIRKAMLMFQAAELAPKDRANSFRETAERWLTDSSSILNTSNERGFSRVLIILMQNYGAHLCAPSLHASTIQNTDAITVNRLKLTWSELLGRILLRLGKGTYKFNPSREKAWLNARLNRQ